MSEEISIELVLFDVGGVLGTNGWDHEERAAAAKHFGFDHDAFEARHAEAVDTWEAGAMTMAEYLDFAVFDVPRDFDRIEFEAFMYAQSVGWPDTLELARKLASNHALRLMTMNNESAELHEHRAHLFGLETIFSAFLLSAYLGARKPHDLFYHRALSVARAIPERTVFIDDRPENLAPVTARGVHTIHAQGLQSIIDGLAALGVRV